MRLGVVSLILGFLVIDVIGELDLYLVVRIGLTVDVLTEYNEDDLNFVGIDTVVVETGFFCRGFNVGRLDVCLNFVGLAEDSGLGVETIGFGGRGGDDITIGGFIVGEIGGGSGL